MCTPDHLASFRFQFKTHMIRRHLQSDGRWTVSAVPCCFLMHHKSQGCHPPVMIKFPHFSPTYQGNIYGVSTLKMHVISDCNTHIYSHFNYDNYGLLSAKHCLVKNSFLAHFTSTTILAVTDHMQEHIFPDFPFFP